jgi:hypothetical protein
MTLPGSSVSYGSSAVTRRSRVSSRSVVPSVLATRFRPAAPLLLAAAVLGMLSGAGLGTLSLIGLGPLSGIGLGTLSVIGLGPLSGAVLGMLSGAGLGTTSGIGLGMLSGIGLGALSGAVLGTSSEISLGGLAAGVLAAGALVLAGGAVLASARPFRTGSAAVLACAPLLLCSVRCSGSSRFFSLATGCLGVMSSL